MTVGYNATDNCDPVPTCTLAVNSNEADGTTPEWVILDNHHLTLRAERDGNGMGRIYTIALACSDSKGNTPVATTAVTTPHDQGK